VECQVVEKWWQGKIWRYDETGVDGAEAPVENADDDFNGCGNERDVVLDSEAGRVVGYVGYKAERETCCADGDADNSEELEMPAE
jgi:hypothetical protein